MFIPEASNSAHYVESTFSFILVTEVILLSVVTFAMIFFVLRYNKRRNPRAENIEGGPALEIIWTAIPTLLVLIMFYVGWRNFVSIRNVPESAMSINVMSRQWSWQFTYENGKQSETLRVPVGMPVKLVLHSQDVLHCLYVPAFRIKEDCVPGLETYLWFTAKDIGSYDIFCTEYCGLGHSGMISKVIVMSDKDFQTWLESKEEAGMAGQGLRLLQEKGCLGCHTTDGTPKTGPTFKGLLGRKVTVVTGGKERTVTADEEYIRRSILEPQADMVKGYPPVMPKLPVSEDELKTIIGYLNELK